MHFVSCKRSRFIRTYMSRKPNVSTAGNFSDQAVMPDQFLAASASAMVMTAGKASGMAATASEIFVNSIVISSSPWPSRCP